MLAATTMPAAIAEIGGGAYIGWAFMLYQLGSIVAGAATALLVNRLGIRRTMLIARCVAVYRIVLDEIFPEGYPQP